MKKRLKKKLEKENIFIKDFSLEYKRLNELKQSKEYLLKQLNEYLLNCPKEVVISKSMYFALVGYLPPDLKLFLSKYEELN